MFSTPKTAAGVRQIPLVGGSGELTVDWRVGRSERAGIADVRDMVRQTDLAEQRRASVDRSGVQDVRTATRDLVDAATNLLVVGAEKGVPGKVIAELMGHAKVDTTLNVYTQVDRRLTSWSRRHSWLGIVHDCAQTGESVGANSLKNWLAALDDFRNWLIREAA